MSVIINMPAGGIQQIDGDELFWFRKAFASEWKGAVMLRLSDDRIYSIEPVDDLGRKFSDAGVPVARLTPPDTRLRVYVNASNVKNVDESNPVIYHEKARSVLVFSRKIRLAVREDVDEARRLLKEARENTSGRKPASRS